MPRYDWLIDGGYLSWVFGTRPEWGGWDTTKQKYTKSLIVLDSPHSLRLAIYPDYKVKRVTKRREDNEWSFRREAVMGFRRYLRADSLVPTFEVPGAEADDIVAILWMKGWGERVMAVDKDLLQVPGIILTNHHNEPMVHKKRMFPNYVKLPTNPWGFALCQALFGDKSDSIPRLMPSNGYQSRDLWHRIKSDVDPLGCAYSLFGERFWVNLQLVLIPTPLLRPEEFIFPANGRQQLFKALKNRSYWNPDLWVVPEQVLEEW